MKAKTQIEDFRVVMRGLMAAYPKDNFIPNEYTFNLWYATLCDIDFPTLTRAAKSYIMSNKFPPGISDIRQIAYDLDSPADELAAEEWVRLTRALGHAGSPEAADYWNRLPEITKEIIGGFSEFREWSLMPTVDLMTVQRPMFIKRYEEKSKLRRLRGAVPTALRTPVKELTAATVARLEEHSQDASKGAVQPEYRPSGAPKDKLEELRRRLRDG